MTSSPNCLDGPVLWDVVEEHFNESEFLFEQWDAALHSPKYNLTELETTIERRLEAHLDGLLIGGREVGLRVLDPELENADEPVRAAVAALALLSTQIERTIGRVIETALQTDGPLQTALARALALAGEGPLDRMLLDRFRASRKDSERALLLEILTGRGVDAGDLLYRCFESEEQRLVGAALDSAGRFGRREIVTVAERYLGSDQPCLRLSAMKASLTFGSEQAWQLCRQLAQESTVADLYILQMIAMFGQPKDQQVVYAQLEKPAGVERILWILGFCGTVQAGDACLSCLESKDERVAKAAGEAIAWMGGFDLNEPRYQMAADEPGEDETLPPVEEDDLGADLKLEGVDDLPVPNPKAIAEWWKENRDRTSRDYRHILGRPFSPEAIVHALEAGPLWRRHGVALELAIRTGGKQHFSTEAFSSRQRRQLAALKGMTAAHWFGLWRKVHYVVHQERHTI
jgi:uncharacterized protein (TIGR02270 family)